MWVESHHLPFLSSLSLDKFRNLEIALETVSFSLLYTFPILFTLPVELNLIFKITQAQQSNSSFS